MSQLIQMQQRIKVIETIKKVTHAMRLIAMSSHAKMQSKKQESSHYCLAITQLFAQVAASLPTYTSHLFTAQETSAEKNLIILIGSQKGLCGNFNNNLVQFFSSMSHENQFHDTTLVIIGKKASDLIKHAAQFQEVVVYEKFNNATLESLTATLIKGITTATNPFTSVKLISNKLKTFFTHQPMVTHLIPFGHNTSTKQPSTATNEDEAYIFAQPIEQILDYLMHELLYTTIRNVLFESLLAEQATRFIAMDKSTRNAQTMLEETKLRYNKLRQTKITNELAELSGSL